MRSCSNLDRNNDARTRITRLGGSIFLFLMSLSFNIHLHAPGNDYQFRVTSYLSSDSSILFLVVWHFPPLSLQCWCDEPSNRNQSSIGLSAFFSHPTFLCLTISDRLAFSSPVVCRFKQFLVKPLLDVRVGISTAAPIFFTLVFAGRSTHHAVN